jgi:hypothetical protein
LRVSEAAIAHFVDNGGNSGIIARFFWLLALTGHAKIAQFRRELEAIPNILISQAS